MMKTLVSEGKVRHIGLSEACPKVIRMCHAIHPIASVQMQQSIGLRDIEDTVIPTCRELGIGVMAYSPLARGVLKEYVSQDEFVKAQDKDDYRTNLPYLSKENYETNMQTVRKCNQIADRLKVSTAQIALAWLLNKGEDVCVIPGTTKVKNLESNMAAASVAAKLTTEDMQMLDDLKPFNGLRYNGGHGTWKSLE